MTTNGLKDDLHHYLRNAREAVVWKLDISTNTADAVR